MSQPLIENNEGAMADIMSRALIAEGFSRDKLTEILHACRTDFNNRSLAQVVAADNGEFDRIMNLIRVERMQGGSPVPVYAKG